MELNEALGWLDSLWDREKHGVPTAGRTSELSLEPMRRLLGALDDPQHASPVLHVTGTNGKGSVCRMSSALLAAHGLSVGLTTSPHLHQPNERIARNLEPIADDDLARVLDEVAEVAPLVGITPSWFEAITAAAFTWFAEVAVDVAVVEVGLLGAFDATNVADATVAVITNVGRDHTDGVGDWRRAIAHEKAGIVKKGSRLVLGEDDPGLRDIFYDTPANGILVLGEDLVVVADQVAVGGRLCDLRTPYGEVDELYLPFHGAHQATNALLALAAVELFFDRPVPADLAQEAFANLHLPARFEIVRRDPVVVVDAAHNPDGLAVTAATLDNELTTSGRRIVVFGALADKPLAEMAAAVASMDPDLVVITAPRSPRAASPVEVAPHFDRLGLVTELHPDPVRAVERAVSYGRDDDVVLITGSAHLAGVARATVLAMEEAEDA